MSIKDCIFISIQHDKVFPILFMLKIFAVTVVSMKKKFHQVTCLVEMFGLIKYISWRCEENRLRFVTITRDMLHKLTYDLLTLSFSLSLPLSLTSFAPSQPQKCCFLRSSFCSTSEEQNKNKTVYLPYFLHPYEILWCLRCILHRCLW